MFTTLKGRKVYGGGGIMPDIFVAADTAEGNAYLSALFFPGSSTSSRSMWRTGSVPRWKPLAAAGLRCRFPRGPGFVGGAEALRGGSGRAGGTLLGGPETGRRAAQGRIARNIWGSSGFYEVLLDDDPIFQRARSEIGGA